MGRIIGIDLGTTNSLAAYWKDGECCLIPNARGGYLTPSVVSVDEDGTVFVGEVARERLITHPDRTASVFKRSMGTDRLYALGSRSFRAEELSAFVLRKLKEDAEKHLGEQVEEAVVSVPAYFGDKARRATRDAGRLAGLKVERIVNEPSAAALACQHLKQQEKARMLVYDFGGGTLDVSLVDCFENVVEIVAVSGDAQLGGSDFDRLIAQKFCETNGMQPFKSQPRAMQQAILRASEAAKRHLSQLQKTIVAVRTQELSGAMELTQKQLVQLSGGLLRRMAEPVRVVLRDSGTRPRDLTQVVLVGGSTKMPIVQQYLRYILKGVPIVTINPDYMVAIGAGIYAGIKERDADVKDVVMTDICPFSLGTNVRNEADESNSYMSVIIPRNSALPISQTQSYCNSADGQRQSLIGVYQGEDLYVQNNVKLGELSVDYPPAKKGEQEILVTFSYDINGLLVVHVRVVGTGLEKEVAFLGGKMVDAADAKIAERIRALREVQLNPRNEEAYQLLMAQAERLITELTGEKRAMLAGQIRTFELALNKGRAVELLREAEALKKLMELLGKDAVEFSADTGDVEGFLDWLNGDDNGEDPLSDDWFTIQ